MRGRFLGAGLAVAMSIALPSCEGASTLRWSFRFDDAAMRAESAYLRGRVRRNDCSGTVLFETGMGPSGEMAETPPPLEHGTYSLEIEARNAACGIIAWGCTTISLPDQADRANVVLVSADPLRAACAAGTRCSGGRCAGEVANDGGA